MAYVEISSLSKKFGKIPVLDNINLHVNKGEFLVLVGASGCGKSTLLRMIAGLDNPDKGNISISGKNVSLVPPAKRNVSMVFQNYALYPHLSVYDNMAFGLRQHKISELDINKKIRETAKILKIETFLDCKPKVLSGGQRQRVALGRAMVRAPKVFLFDEPLSNLDAKLRQQMRIEIKKLHTFLKTTMIYVTHDQTEAMTMGDRIAIMKNGVIEQVDSPNKIYNFPKNQFVASFIGNPQMNFIKGEISINKDRFKFSNSDFNISTKNKFSNDIIKENRLVFLGIRPEDIYDFSLDENKYDIKPVSAEVDMVENMGSFKLVHFILGKTSFCAELRKFNDRSKKVDLVFDISKSHLFSYENGELIQ